MLVHPRFAKINTPSLIPFNHVYDEDGESRAAVATFLHPNVVVVTSDNCVVAVVKVFPKSSVL